MRCNCCGGATFHEPTLITQLLVDGEANALQNLQSAPSEETISFDNVTWYYIYAALSRSNQMAALVVSTWSRTFTYLGPMTGERQQGWVLFFIVYPPACRVMTCSTLNKVTIPMLSTKIHLCTFQYHRWLVIPRWRRAPAATCFSATCAGRDRTDVEKHQSQLFHLRVFWAFKNVTKVLK